MFMIGPRHAYIVTWLGFGMNIKVFMPWNMMCMALTQSVAGTVQNSKMIESVRALRYARVAVQSSHSVMAPYATKHSRRRRTHDA